MIKKNNDSDEIDLLEVAKALLHRWWALVLAVVIFGAAAFGYTYFFIDPLYQSSTLLYVNNSDISLGATSFTISNADLTAAQKLVNTYVVILKSRTALSEVIEEAGLNYSYEELKDMISAAAVNSTEVFEVVVTSKDPAEAERIANTIANVLPEKIADIVSGSDVRIVDYAVIPSRRSSPSYTRNTAIGMLLGLVLSAAAVILAGMFDDNIRSEDYLAQAYPEIPLLAVIPDMVGGKHSGGYYRYGGSGYYGYGGYYRKSSTGKIDEKTGNQTIPKQGEQKRA
jgi:capsular polysaccharide biosynthesis protein